MPGETANQGQNIEAVETARLVLLKLLVLETKASLADFLLSPLLCPITKITIGLREARQSDILF